MLPKPNRARYEQMLNDHYQNDIDHSFQNFVYLTNPERGTHVSPRRLKTLIKKGLIANLFHKLDPIAFEVGYKEWRVQ